MLVILCGLPGTGKTTVAREAARRLGATYLRIDSIEDGLKRSHLNIDPPEDAGYRAAYAVAYDNLRHGLTVIADSVNPIALTQDAWLDVARRAHVPAIEVAFVCSDETCHRQRIEARDRPWEVVARREYIAPQNPALVIDTAHEPAEESVAQLIAAIAATR